VIRALLFDFDGTIVDTESVCLRAWEETYRRHGVELSFDRWQHGIGTLNGFDELGHLEELLGTPVDRDAVSEEQRAREQELMASEPLRSGVAEYLDDARRLGLALAIVSSSSDAWVGERLSSLACADGWACVVTANWEPARAKPRPTLYLEALDHLGVAADEAVAFEDSPNGVAAARAAGIFTVAVPNPVTARLDVTQADVVLDSLADVPLADLLARIG
jgi:HAD superfamily hydrolase (TIGR01509 family)